MHADSRQCLLDRAGAKLQCGKSEQLKAANLCIQIDTYICASKANQNCLFYLLHMITSANL